MEHIYDYIATENINMLHNNTIFDVVILAMIATVGSAGVYLLVAAWIGSGQGSAIIITKVGSLNVITLELCGLYSA